MVVRWKRPSRPEHRPHPLAHRLGAAAPARPRGLPARPLPRARALAQGSLPGPRPQVLGPYSGQARPSGTRRRDRAAHRPAAACQRAGRAGPAGLTDLATLAAPRIPRRHLAPVTLSPPDVVRTANNFFFCSPPGGYAGGWVSSPHLLLLC